MFQRDGFWWNCIGNTAGRAGSPLPAGEWGGCGKAARGVEDAAPYGVREGCSVGRAVRRPEDWPPYGC